MSGNKIICIACPQGCPITVHSDDNGKITEIGGYRCPQGKKYATEEFLNPTRILPTTVRVRNGEIPLVSVKTAKPIPRKLLLPAMKELAKIEVEAPINCDDLIVKNILDTKVNVVATRNVNKTNQLTN